jgi:hypothetical protein
MLHIVAIYSGFAGNKCQIDISIWLGTEVWNMFVGRFLAFMSLSGEAVLTVDGFLPKLLAGTVAAWAALYATTSGVKAIRDWWGIVASDSMPIDEAIGTSELVQIQGRVRPAKPDDAFVSPILGDECVAYEYEIRKVVQDSGRTQIDSATEYNSFIISDGITDILVDPDKESLSLNTTTKTPSTKRSIEQKLADDRLEVDPSVYTSTLGDTTKPIEVSEGTIGVGEKITVVGKATPVPAEAVTDADAVMLSEDAHLTVMNDDSGNTALRKAGRGGFLLLFGIILAAFTILILTPIVFEIVATVG